MNSITLVAATHSKLKKAADGTSTQVAICMINKWRGKNNGKEVYNVRDPPGIVEEKKKREIEGRRLLFLPPWKASAMKHRRTKKKN